MALFLPSSVTGMGSYNGCIFLQLTVQNGLLRGGLMELKGPASLSWILWPGADGEEKSHAAVF